MKAWLEWSWERHASVAVEWGVATMIVVLIVRLIQVLRGYPTVTFTFGTHTLVYNPAWDAAVAYLAIIIPWLAVVGVGKWAESGLEGKEVTGTLINFLFTGVTVGLVMGLLYSNDPAGIVLNNALGLALAGLLAGGMGALAANMPPPSHLPRGLFSGLLYGLIIGMAFGLTTGGVLGGLVFCLVAAGISCAFTALITGMVIAGGRIIRNQSWKTFLKRFWGWMTS